MNDFNFDTINVHDFDESKVIPNELVVTFRNFIINTFPLAQYKSVFEPGIGNGRIALIFAELGYQVSGVDVSIKMLEKLRSECMKRSVEMEFKLESALNTSKISESADLVIVSHLFHLVSNIDYLLIEINRITINRLKLKLIKIYI